MTILILIMEVLCNIGPIEPNFHHFMVLGDFLRKNDLKKIIFFSFFYSLHFIYEMSMILFISGQINFTI